MAVRRPVEVGDVLPPVLLQTAEGTEVELGHYLDRFLIVQCLRYYG
jgi:hypothetical protein